jgi:hypothetical protein
MESFGYGISPASDPKKRAQPLSRSHKGLCLLVGALLLLGKVEVSHAASSLITYTFEGAVTYVSPELAAAFSLGNTIHGQLTIDSGTVGTEPAPGLGYYADAVKSFSVVINGNTYSLQGSFIQVFDNWSGDPGLYQYDFGMYATGPGVANYVPRLFQIGLASISTPPAITSISLPGQALNQTNFAGNFDFNFGNPVSGPNFAVDGNLSSFAPVPTFAGTPGYSNCHGQSVAALAQQDGGLRAAAQALGYTSVKALQDAITAFCHV